MNRILLLIFALVSSSALADDTLPVRSGFRAIQVEVDTPGLEGWILAGSRVSLVAREPTRKDSSTPDFVVNCARALRSMERGPSPCNVLTLEVPNESFDRINPLSKGCKLHAILEMCDNDGGIASNGSGQKTAK